jgi:type IV pilus biogenesis protein CpaD/CtpE
MHTDIRCPTRLFVLLALGLAGCTGDPFERAGTWHPEGVNQANLRAMVTDPHDLDEGVSEPGSNGRLTAAAVARLRAGQVKALPDNGISKVGGSGGGASAAPSGPPAGGV